MVSVMTALCELDRGSERVSRSPDCACALPLREMRAPTTMRAALDRFICGTIAWLSSRVMLSGRSAARRRWMARGAREPSAARANTNSTSSGATRWASSGARFTRMSSRGAGGTSKAGTEGVSADAASPVCAFSSSMRWRRLSRIGLSSGSVAMSFSHVALAVSVSPDWNWAMPSSHRPRWWFGSRSRARCSNVSGSPSKRAPGVERACASAVSTRTSGASGVSASARARAGA